MKTFNTLLQTLSLLLLLLAGQVAQATTKTVTYTLDYYYSNGNYSLRLLRSGDTPFDGTTTDVIDQQLFSYRTSAYFNLPDGFSFYFGWGSATSLKSNSLGYCHDEVNLEYRVQWNFLSGSGPRYYVTQVQLTDKNGTPMKLEGGGTAVTDYNFREQESKTYTAAKGPSSSNNTGIFKKLTITYSDAPGLGIFTPAGTGTDSYWIRDREDLRHLADYVNIGKNDCQGLTFLQAQDIVCDATYTPIGHNLSNTDIAYFSGTYDGQGKTISGITVDRNGGNTPADDYVGIFGFIQAGTVQNVILANSTFIARYYVGGIVGYNNYGTVRNCRVESDVYIKAGYSGANCHGGIVGRNNYIKGSYPLVSGCVSAAEITRNGYGNCGAFGGIVGYNFAGTIRDCLYTGSTITTTASSTSATTRGCIVGHNNLTEVKLYNNYYTNADIAGIGANDGNVQGNIGGARLAYTVTLGENISLVGNETAYTVSGLTAIGTGNYALRYGTTLYSGEGQTLTLNYTGTIPTGHNLEYSATTGTINGATLTLAADNTEVSATFPVIPWTGSGDSADDPYVIIYTSQMEKLASDVNGGISDYAGKFFALGNDLIYDHSSAWNVTASDESNYTPIGYRNGNQDIAFFKGTFDGKGHTVSGIRVYSANGYAGLFGYAGTGSIIRNLTLTDTRITGKNDVGGIAGYNAGNLVNCHVTATVCIHGAWNDIVYHGGIVGYNYNQIQGCTSSATLSLADGLTGCNQFGGIAGRNSGSVSNNLVVGAVLPAVTQVGAIAGYCNNTNNYDINGGCYFNLFRDCSVDGTPTDVGFTYNDNNYSPTGRAEPGFLLSVGEGLTASPAIILLNQFTQRKIIYDYDGLTLYKTEPDDNHTVIVYNGTSYYGLGSVVDLDGASNIQATKTADGTDVTADVLSGTKLTMPAYDVTLAIVVGSVRAFLKDGHYWATYYNGSSRKILPAGATAYTMDSNKHLYRLGTDGSVIPAGVAVVIMADSDTIELTSSDDTSAVTDNAPGGNILQGSDTAVSTSSLSGTAYVLSSNTRYTELGFRHFSGMTIPANRAYYVVSYQ